MWCQNTTDFVKVCSEISCLKVKSINSSLILSALSFNLLLSSMLSKMSRIVFFSFYLVHGILW